MPRTSTETAISISSSWSKRANSLTCCGTGTRGRFAPRFEEPITEPFGLQTAPTATSLALGDIDGDGDIDVFLVAGSNEEGYHVYFYEDLGR
jgi:hypothetical protein